MGCFLTVPSKHNVQSAIIYEFDPKQDITTFELAKCMKLLLETRDSFTGMKSRLVDLGIREDDHIDIGEQLNILGIKRHFKLIQPRETITEKSG